MKTPPVNFPRKGVPWKEESGKGGADGTAARVTAGVPMARIVPRRIADIPEIVMLSQPRSIAAEKFRRLKTVLLNVEDREAPQVIVVTSATPGDGKSMVSINLALAFAADGSGDVLLVDADMRRPTIEGWLIPPPTLGLSEVLAGHTTLEHAVLDIKDSSLKVLPAGHPPKETAELLASESCAALVSGLRQQYRRIVIDTPPIVPFSDADVIGGRSDGILMVVREGVTPRPLFLQALGSVSSTIILGTILNDAKFNLADRHLYHDNYYLRYYDEERRK
jgi:capsular exopolysaccharide synthesis family protein